MKKITLLSIVLIAFLCARSQEAASPKVDSVSYVSAAKEKDAIGKPFPHFNISNKNVAWSNEMLLGKTVYINFWFTACAPCMAEMSQLNELYNRYKSDSNFVFISITFDDTAMISAARLKYQVAYDMFSIPRDECRRLNTSFTYPANFVVDREGIVCFYETGGQVLKWLTNKYFKNKIYPAISKSLNGG